MLSWRIAGTEGRTRTGVKLLDTLFAVSFFTAFSLSSRHTIRWASHLLLHKTTGADSALSWRPVNWAVSSPAGQVKLRATQDKVVIPLTYNDKTHVLGSSCWHVLL